MSWFGTLVNSLRLDDDESDAVSKPDVSDSPALRSDEGQSGRGGGVKEDLSEITKTLTRQLWGVASFLAPPPPQSPTEESTSGEADDRDGSESAAAAGAGIDGIGRDFAEIGGRFRSGITKLSGGAKADFDMSDAQQEHALAVERLVPELAGFRFELCPACMSEDLFWKIYFCARCLGLNVGSLNRAAFS